MYNSQLDTFICVADAGSFNKAAEELYITPPAVIKQINLLEENLGLTLFVRTHRGLILTEAGKSLYQDAKYVIQYCKESVVRARNAVPVGEPIVRIGISPMTPGQYPARLWSQIHKFCPDIKLQMVPFENTVENAREILRNLGQNIDMVAGPYDHEFLKSRGCEAIQISNEPIRVAVSVHHHLAAKVSLTVQDLYGENLMLIHRGWNSYVDALRDYVWQQHSQIQIVDFDFYDVSVFNRCENGNDVLMIIDAWKDIHPLLKILPVEWDYIIPFGLLHAPESSQAVQQFLDAANRALT